MSAGQPVRPRPRVLVVDDQPANLLILEYQLRELDCDVELAADGAQALEKAGAQPFDLILLDCQLPDLDGYAVAERIRAHESGTGAHMPILAISSATDDEHQQRVMASGMDGMLTKPIREDVLRDLLALWCDRADDVQAHMPVTAAVGRDLWSVYLESLDEDLERLAHAIAAADLEGLRHAAHRIKGAALAVEQGTIAQRAGALEAVLKQAAAIPIDAPDTLAELRRQRDNLRAGSTAG
ncbi:response regulator [Ralstonia soli]|uniref:Response regulator n=1 Tax=Ralstonia soli TaxID=2953896 RepID=A0ABT1AR29_9RALS|nr:response regulator [Ralstonia soli]MCO5400736.1 response regulator [Ralstonia soli]